VVVTFLSVIHGFHKTVTPHTENQNHMSPQNNTESREQLQPNQQQLLSKQKRVKLENKSKPFLCKTKIVELSRMRISSHNP